SGWSDGRHQQLPDGEGQDGPTSRAESGRSRVARALASVGARSPRRAAHGEMLLLKPWHRAAAATRAVYPPATPDELASCRRSTERSGSRPCSTDGSARKSSTSRIGTSTTWSACAPFAAHVKLLLDTGVLGQICHPRKHAEVRAWFRRAVREHAFIVSELADYELRRELLRLGAAKMGPRFGRQRTSG